VLLVVSSRDRSPLVLVRIRVPHASRLFAGSARGSKSKSFLDVLPDGHGAEDVEEDETAVGHVVSGDVPVTYSLDPVDGCEGQLGDNSAVEDGVEHRQQGSEREPDCKH